jgi:hypothetical protein
MLHELNSVRVLTNQLFSMKHPQQYGPQAIVHVPLSTNPAKIKCHGLLLSTFTIPRDFLHTVYECQKWKNQRAVLEQNPKASKKYPPCKVKPNLASFRLLPLFTRQSLRRPHKSDRSWLHPPFPNPLYSPTSKHTDKKLAIVLWGTPQRVPGGPSSIS